MDLPRETNEDLSSLRTNSKQAGEYDGDHHSNEHAIIRDGGGDSKKAEEVQGMARNKLKTVQQCTWNLTRKLTRFGAIF